MGVAIKDGRFVDEHGRTVLLRGINLAADAKLPRVAAVDGDKYSYVGSPFPLDEADEHFARLKKLGYNVVRYLFTWDALEHKGPGQYDEEYIDYTIEMLRKLRKHGFMVFMDPHQDVWSLHTGGSGAPEWTLLAAGLDRAGFAETHAAVVHDFDAKDPIIMHWASNYHRLACQVMFTLFFAGETFAPKCKLNGRNLGAYLADHYFAAVEHFARRVHAVPELRDTVIGWESMNEPGHGLIGYGDITVLPDEPHHVKLGTAPTPYEAMRLGCGEPATVEKWTFTAVGPRKSGTADIRPRRGCWLSPEQLRDVDARFGWERSWPGGCIWRLHGLYDDRRPLLKNYFAYDKSGRPLTDSSFVNTVFVQHWQRYFDTISSVSPSWLVLMQCPVNNPPPDLVSQNIKLDASRVVYTPHYYDGLTLMLRRWRLFNVNAIGVMRNHYRFTPILSVRLGERAIRTSFRDQFRFICAESAALLGPGIPVLMSEVGIPFDIDDKAAFASGDYSAQIRALDANMYGLEGALLNYTLWVYAGFNTHAKGDCWNGEDLSIYSTDDVPTDAARRRDDGTDGLRAREAVIRPAPLAVSGTIVAYSFDIHKAVFTLRISADAALAKTHPTLVYVPFFECPLRTLDISTTAGTYTVDEPNNLLSWSHPGGSQTLTIRGEPRTIKDSALCRIV